VIVAGDLRTVARTCRAALEPFRDGDWDGPAADLEWSRRATLAHLLAALTFYSVNLATRSEEPRSGGQANDSMDIEHLLDALEGRAEVLAVVCEAAPPEARGGHEYGRSDPEGFVAMACDELLIHSYDILSGFGARIAPPPDGVGGRILDRLFPWAPRDEADEWSTLLWANGRAPLGDRPRLEPDWVWLSVPLDRWNGEDPNR
jgi:hypothetical protein